MAASVGAFAPKISRRLSETQAASRSVGVVRLSLWIITQPACRATPNLLRLPAVRHSVAGAVSQSQRQRGSDLLCEQRQRFRRK